jgi:nucleotidyltransferase/DNA polymerase involved in DNA repair
MPAERRAARRLRDLRSVGPATVGDLARLGVTTVEALAACEPRALYDRLCAETGTRHDPCVLDVLAAAVAQARDPDLPAEQRDWWWWSRRRRAGAR